MTPSFKRGRLKLGTGKHLEGDVETGNRKMRNQGTGNGLVGEEGAETGNMETWNSLWRRGTETGNALGGSGPETGKMETGNVLGE